MKPQKSSLLLALATSLLNQALGCDKNANYPTSPHVTQSTHSLSLPLPIKKRSRSSNNQEEINDVHLELKDKSSETRQSKTKGSHKDALKTPVDKTIKDNEEKEEEAAVNQENEDKVKKIAEKLENLQALLNQRDQTGNQETINLCRNILEQKKVKRGILGGTKHKYQKMVTAVKFHSGRSQKVLNRQSIKKKAAIEELNNELDRVIQEITANKNMSEEHKQEAKNILLKIQNQEDLFTSIDNSLEKRRKKKGERRKDKSRDLNPFRFLS